MNIDFYRKCLVIGSFVEVGKLLFGTLLGPSTKNSLQKNPKG